MSKGNVMVHVRINPKLLQELQSAYLRWEGNGQQEHRSLSDYIRAAIIEKIAHGKRSRHRRRDRCGTVAERLRKLAAELGHCDGPTADDVGNKDRNGIDHG